MAKRRLLEWMRDKLRKHASDVIIPVKEKRALDEAYKKADASIRATVLKRWPAADMKVLQKHGCASVLVDLRVVFPSGVVTEFLFAKDEGPLRPDRYQSRDQIHQVDEKTATLIEAWQSADELFKSERKKRCAAYEALIAGSGYVEDITEVWPEVAKLLPAGSPPIPLGPEQIALVRADQKETLERP